VKLVGVVDELIGSEISGFSQALEDGRVLDPRPFEARGEQPLFGAEGDTQAVDVRVVGRRGKRN
jgi:hypothetical protein